MLKAVSIKTNPVDRHFLLQTIVEVTYKRRKEPEMHRICREIAEKHISEFAALAPALKQDMGGDLPRVVKPYGFVPRVNGINYSKLRGIRKLPNNMLYNLMAYIHKLWTKIGTVTNKSLITC